MKTTVYEPPNTDYRQSQLYLCFEEPFFVSAMAKIYSTEKAHKIIDQAVQIFDVYGFVVCIWFKSCIAKFDR
jgi:alkylation response protein AidB-like acyl-CoA dehydrogenase